MANRGLNYRDGDDVGGEAARSATLRQGRGAGMDFDATKLASNRDEAKTMGYRGYSPTGPGENDAPWSPNQGELLAFEDKNRGPQPPDADQGEGK